MASRGELALRYPASPVAHGSGRFAETCGRWLLESAACTEGYNLYGPDPRAEPGVGVYERMESKRQADVAGGIPA